MAIIKKTTITTIEIDSKSIDNTIFVNETTELIDDETQDVLAQLDNNRYVLYADSTDFPEIRAAVKEIAIKYAGIWSPVFNA
jgi:hypothetical protein